MTLSHIRARRGPSIRTRRRAAAVLTAAALLLPLCTRATFEDVRAGSWYCEAADALTASGALTGFPDGTFRPQAYVTAAEMVVLAARQAGLQRSPSPSSHWAAGWLQAALDAHWYDWDELPPTGEGWDKPISRQLAVKLIIKALLPEARGEYSKWQGRIRDFAALDGRYYDVTFAAYEAGIVTGDEHGSFRPDAQLTRAEACVLLYRALQASQGQSAPATPPPSPAEKPQMSVEGASAHGWLHVDGAQLCGENGEAVILRGMSSHGLQWYGEFTTAGAIGSTAAWGANVYRIAMYTSEGGYLSDPTLADRAFAAVDAAVANDLYVILDWHILSDGNPQTSQAEAVAFFDRASRRYAETPNVLYEICNEPNGNISWEGNVKPYAEAVIEAIRANSPGVILVGSPSWSQDIHLAAQSPLTGDNIMYTCHFYAGTHGQWLRDRVDDAAAQGLPIFVSEWGVSAADGSGGVFLHEAEVWLDFLEDRGISWCCWSLCDKNESSAALRPNAAPDGPWSWDDLSEGGQFVFSRLKRHRP